MCTISAVTEKEKRNLLIRHITSASCPPESQMSQNDYGEEENNQ